MFYILPLVLCLAYTVYFGGFLVQFLIEKMSMMGSLPPPYGHYVPDVIVSALVVVVTGWSMGPLLPICGQWLARSSILQFLLHLSVSALALSSQFFPYAMSAPKRIVFQHTFHNEGTNRIVESTYDFAVTDSNSLLFLFKNAPELAKELNVSSEFSFELTSLSKRQDWMNQHLNSEKGPRRVHLELYLGFMVKMNGHLDSGSKKKKPYSDKVAKLKAQNMRRLWKIIMLLKQEEKREKEKESMKRADEKYDKEEAAASEDEEF
ncbi:uncharacterized protein LOC107639321 isoform X3 [Arachis ipaensis]|uniref:uncharacterized protein LOC107639321 isoform X3 n=1 Tax=Arachis ipaensis TaxID=130454 RepID=UPI0007AFCF58|nr:uncharacterized protein LOC107639321 isoform X3 [Arachis ipaensis]